MFNLIISIIAIALVVVLAVASLYYGGESFSKGRIETEAARYRNEATQIAGAATMFKARGNSIDSNFTLQVLLDDNFLRELPSGWEPGTGIVKHVLDSAEPGSESICYTANKQSGFIFDGSDAGADTVADEVVDYTEDANFAIPLCEKAGLDPMVPCCIDNT